MRDLEVLLSEVYDSESREHFREAVRAYQAGAYRAAVITTWTSIAYDLTAKIRFLGETNFPEASVLIERLDQSIRQGDRPHLQQFESTLLEKVRDDFELISGQEYRDLTRIYEDRHLCAHPAFVEPTRPFSPGPERVRSYLAIAVDAVLSQPPAPGRQIVDRFSQLVLGVSWPQKNLDAFLKDNYFDRTKESLQRSVAQIIIKGCITFPAEALGSTPGRHRQASASLRNFAPSLHRETVSDVLVKKERGNGLTDVELIHVLAAFGHYQEFWTLVPPGLKDRALSLIEHAAMDLCVEEGLFFMPLPHDPELHALYTARIQTLEQSSLTKLLSEQPAPHFVLRALSILDSSASFRDAEANMRNVLLLTDYLSESDLRIVHESVLTNSQISMAAYMPDLLLNLFEQTRDRLQDLDSWNGLAGELKGRRDAADDYYAYPKLAEAIANAKNKWW